MQRHTFREFSFTNLWSNGMSSRCGLLALTCVMDFWRVSRSCLPYLFCRYPSIRMAGFIEILPSMILPIMIAIEIAAIYSLLPLTPRLSCPVKVGLLILDHGYWHSITSPKLLDQEGTNTRPWILILGHKYLTKIYLWLDINLADSSRPDGETVAATIAASDPKCWLLPLPRYVGNK